MNSSENTGRELRVLIEKALEGANTSEEMVRLNEILIHHPEQRRYYCEYIHMTLGLMRICDETPLTGVQKYDNLYFESLWQALVAEEKVAPAVLTEEPDNTEEDQAKKSEKPKKTVNKMFLGLAAVCLIFLCFILMSAYIYDNFLPQEVATLQTALNAQFDDNRTIPSGTRLKSRQDRLRLKAGMIKIAFDGGASVLIEAPADFRLYSANRLTLHAGRLFAFADHGFTVDTPNSRIVDRGTEFGIRVEPDGTSDLHLFKGKASLRSTVKGRDGRTMSLTAGHAKRVDANGGVEDIALQSWSFVRQFYPKTGFVWRGQGLSLADLIGRGNGLGSGQTNIYIDPVIGYTGSPYSPHKSEGYHPLEDNPFVDGVFIPDGSRRQIVSTQGHEFISCPQTNGESYASLGANPNQGTWATNMRNGLVKFAGQAYGDRNHPCLLMHANLGVTFDLDAVRAQCPDIAVTRFVSQIGIADFNENADCDADFWVLVDGQVRLSQRHVTVKGVLSQIEVTLNSSDRFLTLVTTDGGDVDRPGAYQRSYTCDWCVFVEPRLILETGEEGTVNLRRP